MRRNQMLTIVVACIGMGLLILDGRTALLGAAQGVTLAVSTLVPSLFPFLFLSVLMTGSLKGIHFSWLTPLGRMFHIPMGTEMLLVTSFLGGYPAGAQAVSDAYRSGQITKENGERMLAFCNNAGPAFLFGMTASFFSEGWMLWALWGFHLLGALAAAQMFPCTADTVSSGPGTNLSASAALRKAIAVMAVICGWVILFRVMIAFLDRWVFWLLPTEVRTGIIGLLELSNGICELGSIQDVRLRFLLCSGMLSLGGICVAMQTRSVTGGLGLRNYCWGKLVQTIVSLSCSAALFYDPFLLFPILFLFPFTVRKKAVAICSLLVYNKKTKNYGGKRHAVSQKN